MVPVACNGFCRELKIEEIFLMIYRMVRYRLTD